jgi:hypothetical protein
MTGHRHLLYVLALCEAGLTLLSGIGMWISMGVNPIYLVFGALFAAGYVVAGTVRARWGAYALIIAESLRLLGCVTLSLLLGLFPSLDVTVTGASLVDSIVLPIAVIAVATKVLTPPMTEAAR